MNDMMKNALGIDRLEALEEIYDVAVVNCPSGFHQEGRCFAQSMIAERDQCMFSTCPFIHFMAATMLNGKLISMIFLDVLSMNVGGIMSFLKTEGIGQG